jgi:hypothetical protein
MNESHNKKQKLQQQNQTDQQKLCERRHMK